MQELSRPTTPSRLPVWLEAMRPHQWTKNAFLLAALVYSGRLTDAPAITATGLAVAAFCLGSSSMYLFNDLRDREADALHPEKRHRPIASGRLPIAAAKALSGAALVAALALAAAVGPGFGLVLVAYLVQTVLYTVALKRVVILDVFLVANGFVLRAVAGAVAISVRISPWLILCTVTLALFLGFAKRRSEVVELGDAAEGHRRILAEYPLAFLDQMIAITASSTVLAYSLYSASHDPAGRSGGGALMLTTPFVYFGIFRYLYLLHVKGRGADPAQALLGDLPLLANCLAWAAASALCIYRPDLLPLAG